MTNLANRLKTVRKARGLTQKELADLTGVSQGFISQLESGTRVTPSPYVLKALSAELGIPFEELLGLELQPEPEDSLKSIALRLLVSTLSSDRYSAEHIFRIRDFLRFL